MHADGGIILKNNYIYESFGNIKYRKILREFNIYYIYFEIMFYLYILVHASFSFYVIIYLDDYSVLEIYIVTVNSNSVRNYCSYKKMK